MHEDYNDDDEAAQMDKMLRQWKFGFLDRGESIKIKIIKREENVEKAAELQENIKRSQRIGLNGPPAMICLLSRALWRM